MISLGNTPAKPMNEPKVPMYSRAMIHRCGSLSAAIEPATSPLALVRLSMYLKAPNAASRISGTHIRPATGRLTVPAARSVMAIGTASCATAAPMLPPAAFRPRAQPFSRAG
ncbi:hypothetical protein D9M72_546090 [compost metagenome]